MSLDANIALIDLDGTLVSYDKGVYESLLALHSEYEPPLQREHMHDLPAAYEARRKLIKQVPGWWLGLEKLQLGFDVLEVIHALGFETHILTKGPRNATLAWKEKIEWCLAHIPAEYEVQIVIVSGPIADTDVKVEEQSIKQFTYGKVLVDDFPPYASAWLDRRPRGYAIVPAHKYNTLDKFHERLRSRVLRYDGTNLEEVRALLKRIKDRKPGESL